MIFADAINYAHDLVIECGELYFPHKIEAHNAIDMIEATYKSELQAVAENARLEAENAKMREALNKIENSAYGNAGCLRSPCPHFDDEVTCEHCEYCSTTIAREALAPEGGGK
jgi:hypothetical protein